MIPSVDRSFLKNLKSMDRRLNVGWEDEHFTITYDRGWGKPIKIHNVKNKDGSFRQPDMRDINFIGSGNMKSKNLRDELSKMAYQQVDVVEKIRMKNSCNYCELPKDQREEMMGGYRNLAMDKNVPYHPNGEFYDSEFSQ